MLITLFVFEIILMILTVFTTHMVEHKFEAIHASLGMYCNKRTYKTKADIDFIETIINDYKRLCSDTDEEPDLPSAISLKLHKEYIGHFAYVSIKNIAIKARHLMWGIVVIEILITRINKIDYSGQIIGLIFLSLFLTLMMCFYGIIKGLDEKQEILIDEVTHYIKNVYPLEVKKQEQVAEAARLEKRREHKEQVTEMPCVEEKSITNDKNEEMVNKENYKVTNLSAKDIAQLLKNL